MIHTYFETICEPIFVKKLNIIVYGLNLKEIFVFGFLYLYLNSNSEL